jgi:hypothetical protein
MILSLPWLIVAFLLYNAIALKSCDPAAPEAVFNHAIVTIPMISGVNWTMTLGDILIAFTMVLLFVELVKSTRTTGISIVDHALSTILFILCIVEFITVPVAATSVFFLIMLVTLIDVVAGFSITIKAARRDLAFSGGGSDG